MTLLRDTDAARDATTPWSPPRGGGHAPRLPRRRGSARRLGRVVLEFLVGALGGPAGVALLERARRERNDA